MAGVRNAWWINTIPTIGALKIARALLVRLPARAYRGWFKPPVPQPRQDRNRLLDNTEANRPPGQNGWYSRPSVEGVNERYAHRELNSDPKTWSQDDRQYAARQQFRDNLSAYAESRGGTAWNGGISIPVQVAGRPPQAAGAAQDGTMFVNQSTLETLERMHMKAGKRQLGPTKRLYKSALAEVNESQVKLRLWNGNHRELPPANSPAVNVWRDGVAKATARSDKELNGFIEASGSNKLVKGLDKYKAVDRNPQYTGAIQRIAADVAKQTGRTPQDVLQQFGNEPNGEPWKVAADLMVDEGEAARGLRGNPEAKAQLKEQLGNTYRDSLQDLGAKDCSGMKRGTIARLSGKAGRATNRTVDHQIKDKVKAVGQQREAIGRQTTMDHGGPNAASHNGAAQQAAHSAVIDHQRDGSTPAPHTIYDAHGRPHVSEGGTRPPTAIPAAQAGRNNEGTGRGG